MARVQAGQELARETLPALLRVYLSSVHELWHVPALIGTSSCQNLLLGCMENHESKPGRAKSWV